MKNRIITIFILLETIFCSCGIPQAEVDRLNAKIDSLSTEVDNCKYGSDKLLQEANLYFEQKEYGKCKGSLNTLIEKYPASTEATKAKELLILTNRELVNIHNQNIKDAKERNENEEKRISELTKSMRKKYDDINEITWYRDKTSPEFSNYNGFFGYFGKSKNSPPFLRIRIQYASDDWLFIEKYIIKVDGITYMIEENKHNEIEQDNGDGEIWEWLDRAAGKNEYEIMRAVAFGKDVKIRFVGRQYNKDKTISLSQKTALRNVLEAFESLGGKINN